MKSTKSRFDGSVTIDADRAETVLSELYRTYVHGEKLFQYVNREQHAPQNAFAPDGFKEGGVEHCRWLFFAAMTDRREESNRVYASHARLAKSHPELYTADVIKMPVPDIERILRKEKVGSPGQSARYWPRCADTLFSMFVGNPLYLYQQEEGRIEDILRFKRQWRKDMLPGFGPKILSLLSLFYEELGLMRMPEDAFPVDMHVQRFAISTGIVRGTGKVLNETLEKVLRPFLCKVVFVEGWSALELAHAIWFLGNRLCRGCCRNRTVELSCPCYGECGGAISTTSYSRRGFWDFDAPRHRKGSEKRFVLPESVPLFSVGD